MPPIHTKNRVPKNVWLYKTWQLNKLYINSTSNPGSFKLHCNRHSPIDFYPVYHFPPSNLCQENKIVYFSYFTIDHTAHWNANEFKYFFLNGLQIITFPINNDDHLFHSTPTFHRISTVPSMCQCKTIPFKKWEK